jgi:toxin ParE1/3/4
MNERVTLTPAASNDLDKIWSYSFETWGAKQATVYIRDIQTVLERLVHRTGISQTVNVREGYKKARAGSHMIYFRRPNTDSILVVRILHQRMDVDRHLLS